MLITYVKELLKILGKCDLVKRKYTSTFFLLSVKAKRAQHLENKSHFCQFPPFFQFCGEGKKVLPLKYSPER